MSEAYPLHWPEGWPRTQKPERSRFDVSHGRAQAELLDQLRLMGARYVVISTNVELRRDGLPYAGRRAPEDCGVAVYFQRRGKQMTFACDRWDRVSDNIRAISKTIEAMRGIERWGASDMMERAFAAFEALPPSGAPVQASCWDILGIEPGADTTVIKAMWRKRLKTAHPDQGGTREGIRAGAACLRASDGDGWLMGKRRWFTATERIAWGSPVFVIGNDCKPADASHANGTLLKPDQRTTRRKCNVGENVEVEMIEGLGGRSLHDLANGPCMDPLRIYLPEGKISEAEWERRNRQMAKDAGI